MEAGHPPPVNISFAKENTAAGEFCYSEWAAATPLARARPGNSDDQPRRGLAHAKSRQDGHYSEPDQHPGKDAKTGFVGCPAYDHRHRARTEHFAKRGGARLGLSVDPSRSAVHDALYWHDESQGAAHCARSSIQGEETNERFATDQ
jgi:hypothetical protein